MRDRHWRVRESGVVNALRTALAFALLACWAMLASALVPTVTGWYVVRPDLARSDKPAACAAYAAYRTAQITNGMSSFVVKPNATYPNHCYAEQIVTATGARIGDFLEAYVAVNGACPANSTAVTGGCQCNANYDESGGQCVPHTNQCTSKTGVVGVLSWTEGYTRTPDEGDRQAVGGPVMTPPASGEVCDGGCVVSLQTSGPGVQPFVSQSPTSNGLYRRSVDYPSLGLGKECTMGAADAGAKKDIPPPPCPGSVGDIGNGKPVCVGTAAKPVTATPLGAAPGAEAIAGNPPAGGKPPSGEGSGTGSAGRTPATGDGGPAGGPAGAATGGKGGGAGGTAAGTGSGGGSSPNDNKDPCGGPGQPVCNVKVDEKGTPSGAGETYTPAKQKMDETKTKNDEQLTKAAGNADKGFFEPVRSMFWSPPIAACETFVLPQQVGGLSLDACGVVDGVRNAMAIVWAGAGLFLCFGMIKRSF